jgi:hypothetical protein
MTVMEEGDLVIKYFDSGIALASTSSIVYALVS